MKNLLLFDLGLCYGLPTIVIPALTKLLNEHNRDEFLVITSVQASWLGKWVALSIFDSHLYFKLKNYFVREFEEDFEFKFHESLFKGFSSLILKYLF